MENCPHYEHDGSMREVGKHLYQPGRCKINDYVVDHAYCKIDDQANCTIFLRAENGRLITDLKLTAERAGTCRHGN